MEQRVRPIEILLIEDNPSDVQLIQDHFQKIKHHQFSIHHTADLLSAATLIKQNKYDVILLGFPDSQAFDKLDTVIAYASEQPVIVVAGIKDEELGVQAIEKGAQDYIIKSDIEPTLLSRSIVYSMERYKNETVMRDYAFLVENSEEAIFSKTLDGKVTTWNNAAEKIYGYKKNEIIGQNINITMPVELKSESEKIIQLIKNGQGLKDYETTRIKKDGRELEISISASAIKNRSGDIVGVSIISRDITQKKVYDKQLSIQYRTALTLAEAPNLDLAAHGVLKTICNILKCQIGEIWAVDEKEGVLRCVSYWFSKEEFEPFRKNAYQYALKIGQDIPGYIWQINQPYFSKNLLIDSKDTNLIDLNSTLSGYIGFPVNFHGETLGVMLFFSSTPIHHEIYLSSTFTIIGEQFGNFIKRKRVEDDLLFLSERDFLTGLYNRNSFEKKINESVTNSRVHGDKFALLFLDIDNFKSINDLYGHAVGDRVLNKLVSFLKRSVRTTDILARMGGDEFIFILPEIKDVSVLETIVHNIFNNVHQPFKIEKGMDINITISVGIAVYPHDGEDSATLLKNADLALYKAKEEGKNRYKFCSAEMVELIKKELLIEKSLGSALDNDEFVIYYQPIFNTKTKKIEILEALIRWRHPSLGFLEPEEFIWIAERSHLIINIGEWVVERVSSDLQKLLKRFPELFISVNISAKQIQDDNSVARMIDIITSNNIEVQRIMLELTENGLTKVVNTSAATLMKLKNLGVKILIDDFGTGYSNLGHLKNFNIDYLKIDKSISSKVPKNKVSFDIATAIISLADALGIRVIAEGVETKEQADFYVKFNSHSLQGFYFSQPLDYDSICQFLEKQDGREN